MPSKLTKLIKKNSAKKNNIRMILKKKEKEKEKIILNKTQTHIT